MKDERKVQLERLRSLAGMPAERSAYAATLLSPRHGTEVVRAALRALVESPLPSARAELIRLYEAYAAHPERDYGTYVRSAALAALRPIAEPADLPLFSRAVTTFEFPPPGFHEEAALLRATALLAIGDLDDRLACCHAAGLLMSEHTDPMSGEPAVSAVRQLAASGELLPLYAYALQPATGLVSEVASECLRQLIRLPEELVPHLVTHYAASDDPVVLVGLFDLLLNHETGPHGRERIRAFLSTAERVDVYRYVATSLVASGHAALIEDLLAAAAAEQDRTRAGILLETLALLPATPQVRALIDRLQQLVAARVSRPVLAKVKRT